MWYSLFVIPPIELRVCGSFERTASGTTHFESVYYAESNVPRMMGI